MRRAAVVLVAVMMCAGYSFGQSNGVPQWKVVKEGHISGGTGAINPTVLFTPAKDGFYRVSLYALTSGPFQNSVFFNFVVSWTNRADGLGLAELDECLGGLCFQDQNVIQVFAPKVGTPVSFAVITSDPPPQDSTYDTVFTVEELTH